MLLELEKDQSYWSIFDHVDKLSSFVELVGSSSPARATFICFLFLIPLLFMWSRVIRGFNISIEKQKYWLLGFILAYIGISTFIIWDSTKEYKSNNLKKRVLNEMVYRLWITAPVQKLCSTLEVLDDHLQDLAFSESDYFHYANNDEDIAQFRIVNSEILKVIEKKKKALDEVMRSDKPLPLESIRTLALSREFGDISIDSLQVVALRNTDVDLLQRNKVTYVAKKTASNRPKYNTEQFTKANINLQKTAQKNLVSPQ